MPQLPAITSALHGERLDVAVRRKPFQCRIVSGSPQLPAIDYNRERAKRPGRDLSLFANSANAKAISSHGDMRSPCRIKTRAFLVAKCAASARSPETDACNACRYRVDTKR